MPTDARDDNAGIDGGGVPAPAQVSARIDALIERGLEKYGGGDLLGALCEWEHALALEPGDTRAAEYITYVRENFSLLDEQFRAAREAAARAVESGVPLPDVHQEVSGAYDLVELGFTTPPPSRSASPLDEGWEIDDLAAPLPPPPGASAAALASSLDDDLAAVSAGLDQVQLLGEEAGTGDAPEPELELSSEPRSEDEITVPGGDAPPPLPDRPELSDEALAALGGRGRGRGAIVTISPRSENETSPELPAPPQIATPSELDLELGALDAGVGDDRAPAYDGAPDGGQPLTAADLGLSEEDTGEATSPAGRHRAARLLADEDFRTGERAVFAEEMPTIERGNLPPAASPAAPSALDDDFPELEFGSDPASDPAVPAVGGETRGLAERAPESPQSPAVIIDEQLLRAYDDAADAAEGEKTMSRGALEARRSLLGEPPAPAAAGEPAEERIRRRVNDLLRLAREAAERGDHLSAVEAAELAAAEDPEGLVAPVVLHRHRDLLYRIYEGHIGEMTQVPLVAVPLHQISAEHLDHKTGFLLSRIDGMLSFEDILDVAGMPRLEAYRILSNLLRKGFIEVR